MTPALGLTTSPETRGSHTSGQSTLGISRWGSIEDSRGSAEATSPQLKSALLPKLSGAQGTSQYQKGMANRVFEPLGPRHHSLPRIMGFWALP